MVQLSGALPLRPFVNLARRIRAHFDGIVASVNTAYPTAASKASTPKIRLINNRSYGHPNYESLTAMIHLCLGDITIPSPTETWEGYGRSTPYDGGVGT